MLLKLAQFIVRRRKAIIAVYSLLVVAGLWGQMNGRINYDLLSYLPKNLDSVKGLDIVDKEFALGNMIQVFVKGASDARVEALAERIRGVDGVKAVHWVTDLTPITEPEEFRDAQVNENYYAGGGTLLQVSFHKSSNDPQTKTAVSEIERELKGFDALVTGTQQIELEQVMSRDRVRFSIAALVLVSVVLLLTLPSIVVPILFVITIGVAVIINLGLSYYLGQQLSYITGVIVFALQFAVTMDYALFLYHRFEEERRQGDAEDAMVRSVVATFKSIFAAAATTVAGFLALTVMHLRFGTDMGLTLARGVAITLVAVVTLLPGLMLTALPLMERVRHKVAHVDFSRFGAFIGRHAVPVVIAGAVLFAPAIWANSRIKISYDLNRSLPANLPSVQADKRIAAAFGRAESIFIALQDKGSTVDLERLSNSLGAVKGVTRVFGYGSLVDPRIPVEFVPAEAKNAFYAGGYTYLTVDVAYEIGDTRLPKLLDEIRSVAKKEWPGASYVTGQSVLMNDMEQVSRGDDQRINTISVIAILLIVAIAFRSVVVPFALVGVIELAILLNQSFALFGSGELVFVASLAIGAIQLGATVDYAILVTSRFEEELRNSPDRQRAITVAVGQSSQSILVSASTMFAATIALAVLSSVGIVSQLTMLIARGALISFATVMVLLPAVLVVGQPLFERLSIAWPHASKGE